MRSIGYTKDHDGLIKIVDIEVIDGELYANNVEIYFESTDGPNMKGWPEDGPTHIYKTGGGVEVYVPTSTIIK
jgi:hypothetical protein